MLERIEHGVVTQRRFVADASHELRTPLAVMQAELEIALRNNDPAAVAPEVLDSAAEEVTRMSKIVDDLLTLAHRTRVVQVVTNLVDNAVKYTGPGGLVRLRIWEGQAGLAVQAPVAVCCTRPTGWQLGRGVQPRS
jgi:signal transduction histidine kinase